MLWQGCLYGPNDKDKTLTCVDRDTGWIIWTLDGFGNGSVTLADGKLIALSEDGELCIAEASPAGYRELGKGRILTGKCWTVPVLANGKIYARNAAGHLVCAELMPVGEILPIELAACWNLDETEGDIATNLEPASGGLYIGAGSNLESGSFFGGLIDDVRVYDTALSVEEITALTQ